MPLPLLSLIPLAVEGATAVGELLGAKKAKKRANIPSSVDSRMSAYESELNNQRANLSTGNAYKGFIDSLDKERAATTEKLTKATGGFYGNAIAGAQALNDTYGESLSKFGQSAMGLGADYDQMKGQVVRDMSMRKFNVDQQNYLQNESDYRTKKQSGYENLFSTLEGIAGLDFGGQKVSQDAVSETLDLTAYDDNGTEGFKIDETDTFDMVDEPYGTPSPAFGENYFKPKPFGSNFLSKKKYTLSY